MSAAIEQAKEVEVEKSDPDALSALLQYFPVTTLALAKSMLKAEYLPEASCSDEEVISSMNLSSFISDRTREKVGT